MSVPAAFGFQQLTTEIIRGVVAAVADHPGDTDARRFARQQTVVFSVMAFLPRDAVETMLAGQCVVFDHLLRDGARDLLRGQAETIKLRVRPQLNATGNMVLKTLSHLARLQSRPAEGTAVAPAPRPAEATGAATTPARAAEPAPAPKPATPAAAQPPALPPAAVPGTSPAPAWTPEMPAPSLRSLKGGVSLTALSIASEGAVRGSLFATGTSPLPVPPPQVGASGNPTAISANPSPTAQVR